MRFPLKL